MVNNLRQKYFIFVSKLFSYKIILQIITLSLMAAFFRLYEIGRDSFRFDEGATWYVAYNTTIKDLAYGKYSLEGNVPAFYLFIKLLPFGNEFFLRSISAVIGIASVVVCYLLFRQFEKRAIALFSGFILALSPALVYYSREFRSYMPGFFLQVVSLTFFFFAFKKKKYKMLFCYACILVTLLALFTALSTAYIIIFYFAWFLTNRPDKTNIRLTVLFYSLLVTISTIFGIWIFRYSSSLNGHTALSNYVAYGNRNILASTTTTLKEIIFFYPHWVGPPINYLPLQSSAVFLFILTMGIVLIRKEWLKSTPMLRDMILLFTSTLGAALIFSITIFDVMSIKLLLMLCVPFSYIVASFGVSFAHDAKIENIKNPLVVICAIFFINNGINIFIKQYDFRQIYSHLSSSMASSGCTYAIVSQEAAKGLIAYYDQLQKVQLGKKLILIPINYNVPHQTNDQIEYLIKIDKIRLCDRLLFIRFYDFWNDQTPAHQRFTQLLAAFRRIDIQQQDIDPRRLSLWVFERYHDL